MKKMPAFGGICGRTQNSLKPNVVGRKSIAKIVNLAWAGMCLSDVSTRISQIFRGNLELETVLSSVIQGAEPSGKFQLA